jgi:hypothetical protein
MTALRSGGTAFEQALNDFNAELRPKHRSAFQNTTLPDLLAEIDKLQVDQHSKRRLQAIGRLKPTIEALNQLGKVVETFVNTSEVVAFVWVSPESPSSFCLGTIIRPLRLLTRSSGTTQDSSCCYRYA